MSFDEPNLVSHGGWCSRVGVAAVGPARGDPGGADRAGIGRANANAKVATVVLGMLAGADSIDDLGVLRAGATGRLLGAAKAPSTIETWLRSFTYGHVRQLDAVTRELMTRCWAAGAGPHRLDELLHIDCDSTIIESHGLAKRGAFFGYTKVRGHHPLIARVSEPGQPGWVAHTRFRRGNAAAGGRRRRPEHSPATPRWARARRRELTAALAHYDVQREQHPAELAQLDTQLRHLQQQLQADDRDWTARRDTTNHTPRGPVVVPDVLGKLTPPSPPTRPGRPSLGPGVTIPRRSPDTEPYRPAKGRGHSRSR